MATRYKLSKDQLERVVENFVMEAASAKVPDAARIEAQVFKIRLSLSKLIKNSYLILK